MKSKLLLVALFSILSLKLTVVAQTPPDKPDANAQAASPVDLDAELRRAIESSGGSETQIIANLEEYLKKFPKSAHRSEIENEIYKTSVKLRDRNRAITYAEKIVAGGATNVEVLTNLVTMLRERRGDGDLNKALAHADQLIKQFETLIASAAKPKRISAAQWEQRKQQGIASIYLVRGRVHADLGNDNKARADLLKSFGAARMAGAAITLAELAEKRKNTDEAIDYYSQAFIIALATSEEVDLKAIRRNLGELYVVKQKSEIGLGDRVLKAYDAYIKDRDERAAKLEQPNINEGATNPLAFRLTKLDGSRLEMASLRGKVVVMNFWATWCGPCLTEMPLFEKVQAKYKDDQNVVFLALSTDEDRELVPPHLKQYKFNLPVAYAEHLNDFFSVNSIPTTIILDGKGEVAFRQAGYNPRSDFVADLTEKIEAAKKK
ncbi:MAG: redoxin family protein [Blastocatellia bacterium]